MAVATINMPRPLHVQGHPYLRASNLSSRRSSRPTALVIPPNAKITSRIPHINANPCSTPLSPTAQMSEIAPRIYVSDLSSAEDSVLLGAHGITHILSAMPLTRTPVAHISRDRMVVPLQDTPFAELAGHLPSTTAFIKQALGSSPNARVLVHCAMGASRSVSVAAAYLIASCGMSSAEAVAHVKSRRAVAAPNWGFLMQLEEYARSLDTDANDSDVEAA